MSFPNDNINIYIYIYIYIYMILGRKISSRTSLQYAMYDATLKGGKPIKVQDWQKNIYH